jgi:nanoRNase/pAp phosphatase (c-di-AMP/oligoRNAs hydrolase)
MKWGQRRLHRLLDVLSGHRRLLILAHDNPDPDSIASAWILERLLRRRTALKLRLAYGGIIGRTENRAMIEVLRVPMEPVVGVDVDSFDAIALVDTQPRTGNNSLPPDREATVVFDHHPARRAVRTVPYSDIRAAYGATTTILYEYLVAAEIEPDRRLASAIFHAIRSETQNLGREAEKADARAFLACFPLVDNEAISRIEHSRLHRSYFAMMNRAIAGTTLYGEVAVTRLGEVSHPDMVAEFADLIVRLEGIGWAFCIGRYQGDLLLSIRTHHRKTNAGRVIRTIVASRGTAGGHDMIAGGKIPGGGMTGSRAAREEDLLIRRLLRTLGTPSRRGTPLTRPGRGKSLDRDR